MIDNINRNIAYNIFQALSETIENFAFLEVLIIEDKEDIKISDENYMCYSVKSISPFNINLTLCVLEETANKIVKNVLIENIHFEHSVKDSICEITNILTGNFLDRIFGGKISFSLNLPEEIDMNYLKIKYFRDIKIIKEINVNSKYTDNTIIFAFKLDDKNCFIILDNINEIMNRKA